MMGHPYGQGWRLVSLAERRRRRRERLAAWLLTLAIIGGGAGLAELVGWPW